MIPLPARVRSSLVDTRSYFQWSLRSWSVPAAPPAKRAVLKRYNRPDAKWIETGTYRGDMTAFLASISGSVTSLEPDDALYERARARFAHSPRVKLVHGTSEAKFESIVAETAGQTCFWLDGHYSGPGTHLAQKATPIFHELQVIAKHLPALLAVTVCVDDFREFPSAHDISPRSDYPTREFLVRWAEENCLAWTVEHDIFSAYSPFE